MVIDHHSEERFHSMVLLATSERVRRILTAALRRPPTPREMARAMRAAEENDTVEKGL